MIEFSAIEFVLVLVLAMVLGLICGYHVWK